MEVNIEKSWHNRLEHEFLEEYFKNLVRFIKEEYKTTKIYPPAKLLFAAFDYTPFENVKIVIIGQDPYHGEGQANGLCFSVNDGITIPRSLKNIFKEIKDDLGKEIPQNGNLERWAKQGVLLLNATLSVRANVAGSHQNKGWETFTDAIIKKVNEEKEHMVFILWGTYAQKKGIIIDRNKHLVLESAHPSPFSAERGFFGCKHFSRANNYLKSEGLKEVDW